MGEFALIRSKMGEEYRQKLEKLKEECETHNLNESQHRNFDPSEGSPNQRGSEHGMHLSQTPNQSKQKRPVGDMGKTLPAIAKKRPDDHTIKDCFVIPNQSTLLNACFAAKFPENAIREFVAKALSNRCRTSKHAQMC